MVRDADQEAPWLRFLPGSNNHVYHFIMQKRLMTSDVDIRQCRLIIPSYYVTNNLMPLLHGHERVDGTDVTVYTRSQWSFFPRLTTWKSTGSTVICGKEYKTLLRYCEFKKDDVFNMWAFRSNGKLCFAIDKHVPRPS